MWTSAFRTGRRRGEGHCNCISQMMACNGRTEELGITGIGHLMVGIMEVQVFFFLLIFISAQHDITVRLLKVDTLGVRRTFNIMSTWFGSLDFGCDFFFSFFTRRSLTRALKRQESVSWYFSLFEDLESICHPERCMNLSFFPFLFDTYIRGKSKVQNLGLKNNCSHKERLPWWLSGKEPTCQCRRLVLDPGSGRSPGEGHGSPLQDACLRNPTDPGAWRAAMCGVAKKPATS